MDTTSDNTICSKCNQVERSGTSCTFHIGFPALANFSLASPLLPFWLRNTIDCCCVISPTFCPFWELLPPALSFLSSPLVPFPAPYSPGLPISCPPPFKNMADELKWEIPIITLASSLPRRPVLKSSSRVPSSRSLGRIAWRVNKTSVWAVTQRKVREGFEPGRPN